MVFHILYRNGSSLHFMEMTSINESRPLDFISGEIIAIDKPLHWTSFDAVKRLRGPIQKRLHVKKFKVGHAGTLDPLATGVLIVCTGRATRKIDELQSGLKEYIATIKLGSTTPSFDLETEIDAEYPTDHVTKEKIIEVLDSFKGEILQIPPIFSAVKVDGKRAYKYARNGKEPELKPKPVKITRIELISFENNELKFIVECGKGTYIRSLARDIGKALDTGAHLIELRRTKVGNIRIEDCMQIEEAVKLINESPLCFHASTEHKNKI